MNRATIAVATLLMATSPVCEAATTCLQTMNISNFEYPNDKTIMVHMYGGAIYRNDLPQRCFGLKLSTRGITYTPSVPGSDQLCDNIGIFRVNDTPGETCLWGAFVRVK